MKPLLAFLGGILNGLGEIRAHKFRSLLSMLGIILGVAALVAMVGLVQGMVGEMRDYFERTGGISRLVVESRDPPDEQSHIAHRSPGLTFRDVAAIREACPFVSLIDPEVFLGWRRYTWNGVSERAPLRAVMPDRFEILRHELREGRFIGDLDVETSAPVIVLGGWLADILFPEGDAVGKQLNLHGQAFQIIGVLENLGVDRNGRNRFWRQNRVAHIPITTGMKRFQGSDRLNSLTLQAVDVTLVNEALHQVERTLLQTHRGIRDFEVSTMDEQLAEFQRLERSFTFALGGIAAITLLVGGIGIMNVMLAAINERIREIGIRKAVGAQGHDLFIQFLAEAVVIGMVGGLLGMMVSVGLVEFMKQVVQADEFRIVHSPAAMMAGFGFSLAVGIISGIYPALRAARMNVIDALRHD